MAVTVKNLIPATPVPNGATTMYTAPAGTTTIIDKLTAYNTNNAPVTITVNLVAPAGVATGNNTVVTKVLAANETYTFPEVVNHALPAGGFLAASASTANVVSLRASGREIT